MDEEKKKAPVDILLLIGLGLYALYSILTHTVCVIPDYLAYPWMLISVACMLVGVFRTGMKLGRFGK